MRVYSEFVRDLDESRRAVMTVAAFLMQNNKYVLIPPHRVTPSPDERYHFTDEYDLKFSSDCSTWKSLQIKGSSRQFDSVQEFPFDMVTVDEKYKIDQQFANPPHSYLIVNSSLTGAIMVPWSTHFRWDLYESCDERQGDRLCQFRRCPKLACEWVDLRI